jgi:hypothetical protein
MYTPGYRRGMYDYGCIRRTGVLEYGAWCVKVGIRLFFVCDRTAVLAPVPVLLHHRYSVALGYDTYRRNSFRETCFSIY